MKKLIKRVSSASISMVVLAGCMSYGERVLWRANHNDSCGMAYLEDHIGKAFDDLDVEAYLPAENTWRTSDRRLKSQILLTDLNTGRMTISIDEGGLITELECG